MKSNVLGSEYSLTLGIPKSVTEVPSPIPHENTFHSLCIQLVPLLRVHMYINGTSKGSWMSERSVFSRSPLFWQLEVHCSRGTAVDEIDRRVDRIYPERLRQTDMKSHSSGSLVDGTVHPLGDPVLLR